MTRVLLLIACLGALCAGAAAPQAPQRPRALPAQAADVALPAQAADVALPAQTADVALPAQAADVALPAQAAGVSYAAPLPLPLRVSRGFLPPPTPYAAGHRGVDFTADGAVIRAAAAGRVSFAGPVAGRGVVVIVHADGVSTEYEPVRPLVRTGSPVARGQPIGFLHGTHGSCAPGGCLHWGARRSGRYFDPLSLLRPLGPVRLLPWPR